MFGSPQMLILGVPAFVLAICFHEASHAWMALRFGDSTARDLGRLTLNPIRHLDPVGALVFLIAGFGWAKPVPVDPRRLRDPLRDGMWIAAAGPAANLLLAVVSAALLRLVVAGNGLGMGSMAGGLVTFLVVSLTINLILAVFNLIPLHPLDGSKVLAGFLPAGLAAGYQRLAPIGPMLLLGLIMLGRVSGHSLLGAILWPPVSVMRSVLSGGLF